jgi:hypothetical protein
MEEFWFFIERQSQDQRERVLQLNYGLLILQDIMKEGSKQKLMPQTHLGPLFYQNKPLFHVKYT